MSYMIENVADHVVRRGDRLEFVYLKKAGGFVESQVKRVISARGGLTADRAFPIGDGPVIRAFVTVTAHSGNLGALMGGPWIDTTAEKNGGLFEFMHAFDRQMPASNFVTSITKAVEDFDRKVGEAVTGGAQTVENVKTAVTGVNAKLFVFAAFAGIGLALVAAAKLRG